MKILIIEDEEKLAAGIKQGLEKEGFTADYVLDGEAGLKRIQLYHNDYDLVILDLMLPGKDGFEICEAVRKQGLKIPILILTARQATADKVMLLNLGADDYLIKPFSFPELTARVRALLRRPEQLMPVELRVGDLLLNTVSHEVTRAGNVITLSLKEFSLLEYFMRHPNQVLSREEIVDHVWDFVSGSLSNVVDVHIKNLRKKIDADYEKKLLETVHGVGYRIKA